MSPRTVERVDDWETVPFGGGYSGLRDLASQEFSGVVTAGPTQLFMIRGTVVGVLDGSIDDFEDAGGNAREAPHPALPLLAVMQERSDEVRAKYYTEDTPISDVDRTLEDGAFTGYVELSENVLSGDYYQVYHRGRSMSVAYVGSSERLITDDEAFEQADDEVGIYEVRPVEIDAIDIPEPSDDAGGETDTGATGGTATAAPTAGEEEADPGVEEQADDDADTVDIPSAAAGTDESDASESETRERGAASEPDAPAQPEEPADEPAAETTDATRETSSASAEETPTTSSTGEADADPVGEDSTGESDTDDVHPGAAASTSQTSSSSSTDPSSTGQDTTTQPSSDQDSGTGGRTSQSQEASAGRQTTSNAAETERSQPSPGASSSRTDRSGAGDTQSTNSPSGSQNGGDRSSTPPSAGSATDLETRSIPSLDPARTKAASKARAKRKSGGRNGGTAQTSRSQRSQGSQQRSTESRDQSTASQTPGRSAPKENRQSDQRQSEQSPSQGSAEPERSPAEEQDGATEATRPGTTGGGDASDPASELEAREQEIEDLRTDLDRVEAERDELETERADLEAERDRLQAELDEARAEIERLEARLEDFAADGASGAETQLSAGEAIDNTNLFVRYRSKGDATLETAHSGNAGRSEVAENMRLEYHTQFDADEAAVGNEPFDDFLTGTIQYRFVDWIIGSLLYEIRDTGHADGMADLYNALPKIDRAELNGQVSVNYTEDGEEHRSQERFDVVVRDRMGNPLMVANINNSRDPATDAMMTDLVKRAERVGASSESLAGAFLVTESFFEPEALETADGATSSGLFSRDKRKSFVNLSRKDGYHLCLVEARNQEFHLAVPEL